MRANPTSLTSQISRLSLIFGAVLLVALAGLSWWAADRIDDRTVEKQARAIQIGLREIADRLPVDQDSSAIWDDAVVNVRAGNEAWMAENIAEWMSEYYGHDFVYLLSPDNSPVRAVEAGELAPDERFEADRDVILPLVLQLRSEVATSSNGSEDPTAAVTGLGVLDLVVLANGDVGIVSVRPILPSTEAVQQTPGTEYLHVSIRVINRTVSDAIAEKFAIEELRFEPSGTAGTGPAVPVLSEGGRVLGFFSWRPDRPASQLLRETAPGLALAGMAAILAVVFLLRRLSSTSRRLEVSEAKATYLAFHDALAGIPNRALFEDRLERALANRKRSKAPIALHLIDLDRFKHINDTMGHPAGDELIRQTALRLAGLVTDVDTVARLGGDEFAIIQVDLRSTNDALRMSQGIIQALAHPFNLAGEEALVGASVGVVYSEDMDSEPMDLMRHADIALYEAKTSGRGRYQLYAGELDAAVRDRRALETDLRAALQGAPGLHLVYQPVFDGHGSTLVGAEALARWDHPTRGNVAPGEFIGLAEERGLIERLGIWVLREACSFAAGSNLPWVAVNVSPQQFKDERLAERVLAILHETGLAPTRLEIEITEGLLLQNSPTVQATLMRLRASGIRVALDDFGTGYSSISYLRTYGVDKLKIDQSFVAQIGNDLEVHNIVRCIIDLARAMHMKVTAEGVETLEQRTILRNMGCDQLQGYLLSRPVSVQAIEGLLIGPTSDRMAG